MTAEEIKRIVACGETSTVQFKQQWTTQKEMAKEMVAFANTCGGIIVFGINDKNGNISGLHLFVCQT